MTSVTMVGFHGGHRSGQARASQSLSDALRTHTSMCVTDCSLGRARARLTGRPRLGPLAAAVDAGIAVVAPPKLQGDAAVYTAMSPTAAGALRDARVLRGCPERTFSVLHRLDTIAPLAAKIHRSTRSVALSTSLADHLRGAGIGVVDIIPNTISHELANAHPAAARAQCGPLDVLYFGPSSPEKGFEVARTLAGPSAGAVWLRLHNAGNDIAMDGAICHSYLRSEEAIARLYSGVDVLVFPSTYRLEAQPLTIIEAMAFGVIPVVYDRPQLLDMLPEDLAVHSAGVTDAVSLRRALKRIHEAEELLPELSARAVAHYREVFAPETVAGAWQHLLDDR